MPREVIDIEILLEETLENEPAEEELEEDHDVDIYLQQYEEVLNVHAEHSDSKAREIYEVLLQSPSLRSASHSTTPSDVTPRLPAQTHCSPSIVIQSTPQVGQPSIPLDIFMEIVSEVGPLELLRCSRASKTLRSMLLSLRCRSLWQQALEEIPQLPPCPVDMSEILYTALLFDDHCFSCGAGGAHSVDYALRVRLCRPCWQENICEGTTALDNIPVAVQNTVMMLVPCEVSIDPKDKEVFYLFWRLQPEEHVLQDFYHRGQLDTVLKKLWPPPDATEYAILRPLLIERTKYVLRRQAHAFTLHLWEARVRKRRADGSTIILPSSQLDSLRARCVSYELADTSVDGPEDQLDAIPDHIVTQLQRDYEERVKRQDAVYEERLQTRYDQLAVFYDELLQGPWSRLDQRLFPNKHDGARLLCDIATVNDARGSVSRRTFYDYETLHDLKSDMGFYANDYARHLASVVTSGIEAELGAESASKLADRSPREILRMPWALFTCTVCFEGPFAYPDIHVHWREEHPDISVWRRSDLRFLQASKSGKDICERVALWREGLAVTPKILKVVGIAQNASVAQLNKVVSSGRLYCTCGDPSVPDVCELTWADFVFHVHDANFWSRSREMSREKVETVDGSLLSVDDHEGWKCLTYLPQGADTSPAHYRVCADPETRARIEARLAQRSEDSEVVCRICDALTDEDGRDWQLTLEPEADCTVYHFQAKHLKAFEDSDGFFSDSKIYKRTVYTWD